MNAFAASGQSQTQVNEAAKTLARSLFNSSAYAARNRSDHDFVYDLYLACFQRQPDQGGWDYWTGQVPYSGRANVVEAFVASSEFAIYTRVLYGIDLFDTKRTDLFLSAFYSAALNRGPSGAEQTAQRNAFDTASATGRTTVIAAVQTFGDSLFNSAEYAARNRSNHDYVYDLYWAYLQYGPDTSGWSYWEGQVASLGRTAVRNSFAVTPTFQEIAGGLYREVLWLTPDQLGTPRMIAERTGALAGIKRHDYLPFGEELYAGQGGRAQGYSAGDGARQKFTSKERDNETGLDYFNSRYHSSGQGRFTSPDSYGGRSVNPQTLNLYSYVRNNPLRYIDPTGHFGQDPNNDPNRPNPNAPCPCYAEGEDEDTLKTNSDQKKDRTVEGGIDWDAWNQWSMRQNQKTLHFFLTFEKYSFAPISGVIKLVGGDSAVADYHHTSMALIPIAMEAGFEANVERTEVIVEDLLDETLVVRGGMNLAENFSGGSGVINNNGILSNVSVNSADGKTVEQLLTGIKNGQIGVTTVGSIRQAGGGIFRDPTDLNPSHCLMCGLSAERFSQLFTPTQPKPKP